MTGDAGADVNVQLLQENECSTSPEADEVNPVVHSNRSIWFKPPTGLRARLRLPNPRCKADRQHSRNPRRSKQRRKARVAPGYPLE